MLLDVMLAVDVVLIILFGSQESLNVEGNLENEIAVELLFCFVFNLG